MPAERIGMRDAREIIRHSRRPPGSEDGDGCSSGSFSGSKSPRRRLATRLSWVWR